MEIGRSSNCCSTTAGCRGFTYIETMVSMLILVLGLCGILGLLAYSLAMLTISQDEMIAKQKAREALESIFTARNTQQLVFSDIRNASAGGIFLEGFQPLRLPNSEGLVGTSGDGAYEVLVTPGADGIPGNEDDEVRSLERFERQIQITDLGGGNDLRELTVTVRYTTTQGWQRAYQVQAYISRFR